MSLKVKNHRKDPCLPWRVLVLLLTGVVAYYTIYPGYPLKHSLSQIPFSDTLVHLFSFGILMYCCCRSWEQKQIRIILGVSLVVLGIGLEALQTKLVGGHFEIKDNFSNTLGVVLGYIFGAFQKFVSRSL